MYNTIPERIEALRQEMRAAGISAVIIPQTDPHQGEYLSSHWQVRRWLSGFNGSAGTLVVTTREALLWTDSRYFIQAAQQLAGTGIVLMKDGLPETPSIEKYLISNLVPGSVVGIDGMVYSAAEADVLAKALGKHGIKLDTTFDVIDKLWTDRPALPNDKVFVHDIKYAGCGARAKIATVMQGVEDQMADSMLVSALDEIAWMLNIRSNDVKYNPVVTSFLFLSPKMGNILFVDPAKMDESTIAYLQGEGVSTRAYTDIIPFLNALPADMRVLVQPERNAQALVSALGERAVYGSSPVAVPKACRNDVQIAGTRAAMERDGVALVRAFIELEQRMAQGVTTTELDVSDILRKHRSAMPLFFDESFGTIAGYAEHGAIVHYEATEETSSTLRPEGLLLIDSGAQYLDGTTDITRTIALGIPTEQEKHDFTLVMKGHIAISRAIFPAGTRGAQLTAMAHQYLWREGLNYLHGTGHGVGHFLNVHEGPQSIRLNYTPTPIYPGMVTSDEPGLYREGVHGIRCENLVLCVPAMTTEFGQFLQFEPLTLMPFDIRLFDTAIMTPEEIAWVNDYHTMVYNRLSPYLDAAEQAWLKDATQPLVK